MQRCAHRSTKLFDPQWKPRWAPSRVFRRVPPARACESLCTDVLFINLHPLVGLLVEAGSVREASSLKETQSAFGDSANSEKSFIFSCNFTKCTSTRPQNIHLCVNQCLMCLMLTLDIYQSSKGGMILHICKSNKLCAVKHSVAHL